MNSGTPASTPPGPAPSDGIRRPTAALMNAHSAVLKNVGAYLDGADVRLLSEHAERPSVPNVTAGATPKRRNRRLSSGEELPIRSHLPFGHYVVLGECCRSK